VACLLNEPLRPTRGCDRPHAPGHAFLSSDGSWTPALPCVRREDVGYGARGRGGGFRGRGFRGRGRGRGRGYASGAPEGPIDELKVYVGGLSWNVDDQGLAAAFAPFGECEAHVMIDKYTGRSRGFAFVTYQTPEACQAAIEAMNGKEIDGRSITCNNARQRIYAEEPPAPEAEGGHDGEGGDADPGGQMGGGEEHGDDGVME
jgi:cold-inducible RNA-binding protein